MLYTIPLSPIDLASIYKSKTDSYVLHVDYTKSKEQLTAKQILIYLANTGFRCTFDSIDDDLIQAYMEMDFLVDSPVLSRIVVEIIKQRMDDKTSAPSQKELVDDWINAMAELPAFVMGNVNDQECEVAFDVDAIGKYKSPSRVGLNFYHVAANGMDAIAKVISTTGFRGKFNTEFFNDKPKFKGRDIYSALHSKGVVDFVINLLPSKEIVIPNESQA
jgi:hypothetical protein